MADSVSVKVLQTGSGYGYLVHVGGKCIKIVGESISQLQVLSRNTRENIETALARSTLASSFSKQFAVQARIASHDNGSSNAPAERALENKRGSWASLQLSCDAHGCFNMVSGTFNKLLGSDVTGLIATALILRAGNNLQIFRACLHDEIASEVVILRGAPSSEAIQWRKRAMRTFMDDSSLRF